MNNGDTKCVTKTKTEIKRIRVRNLVNKIEEIILDEAKSISVTDTCSTSKCIKLELLTHLQALIRQEFAELLRGE